MIKVSNLSKSFKTIKAVDNVSFEIPKSKITIITGADGAGKSTVFRMIIGLVRKDSGTIFLDNNDIGEDHKKITSITGYMPEQFSLYLDLTVEENMNFFSDIQGVDPKRRETLKNTLLEKTGMIAFKKRRAGALSGGMKQKLALSTILLSAPQFIILDEPTTGVDPLSRIEFFNIIRELKEEGKTIIISTPYLDEAEKGDHIIFLKSGKIIKKDTITNLKAEFPEKIFRILPKGNVYEILQELHQKPSLRDRVFIKGKYLRCIQKQEEFTLPSIPHISVEEEKPTLEDIYLYYERGQEEKSDDTHV